MKREFDIHRDIWGPYMTQLLEQWSGSVFRAARQLQVLGFAPGPVQGAVPPKDSRAAQPPPLTAGGLFLDLLEPLPPGYDKMKHFDYSAEEYELATHRFKSWFLDRAFELVRTQLDAGSYILDASCGPGYEALRLSALAPAGEVIALDLSQAMLKRAYRNARLERRRNMGFVQADVHRLPDRFHRHFDLVFCCLSLHFYERPAQALAQFRQALRPGGRLILIEPNRTAAQRRAAHVLNLALPQFQGFYTHDEVAGLLREAGLSPLYQEAIQKDMVLTIAG